MFQENFKDWKGHLEKKYRIAKKDADGNPVRLRDVHWMNFGWGDGVDPTTGASRLEYHPNEVWMRYGFSKAEPWKKVKITRITSNEEEAPQIYNQDIRLNAAKIKDLHAMAKKHIPEPQRQYYLNLMAEDSDTDE